MFTGIIESTGIIKEIFPNGSNKTFWIESAISGELKIDQSLNHNGVCLTVEEIRDKSHRVSAIKETRDKTNLDDWKSGTIINLERSLKLDSRIDGHLVQGHTDTTATCIKIKEKKGSTEFVFEFPKKFAPYLVEKGSICLDGISLTVFDVTKKRFTVAIIPYTLQHTNMQYVKEGDQVNLEFDLIGKYILRKLSLK
jgi:riboflavin synthase